MNEQKKDDNTLLADVDEKQLRRQLLIEKLELARLENRRGWLWHMGPTFAAIGASIAASIVVLLFGSEMGKGVVDYYETNVTGARQQLETVESEVEKSEIKLKAVNRDIESASLRRTELLNKISAIEDYQKIEFLEDVGIGIKIQDNGTSYSLNIETFPQGATISVFSECDKNFIFPGESPDPNKCQLFYSLNCIDGYFAEKINEPVAGKSPCLTKPIQKMGNMDNTVWVSAEHDGKKSYKYVHLTGY